METRKREHVCRKWRRGVGKQGGRQKQAGKEKGRGGGAAQWAMGGQPCPAQPSVQSRAQKNPTHGPAPVRWASPGTRKPASMARKAATSTTSPNVLPVLCCHPGPGTTELESHPTGIGHLGGSQLGPEEARLQRQPEQPTPPLKLPAQPGPWGLDIWEEPPLGSAGGRWDHKTDSLLSSSLLSQPGALAFLLG